MRKTPDPGPDTGSEADSAGLVTIDAGLPPALAGQMRDRLLSALAWATASDAPLTVEVGEGTTLPCALQLLVSARKSAELAGIPFHPGGRAMAALGALDQPPVAELETQ